MRRLVTGLLLLSFAFLAFTQEKPFGASVNVTAIEVIAEVVDATGKTPADLKPADFILYENGVEQPIVSLEYLGPASAQPAITQTIATPAAQTATPPPIVTENPARNPWDILIYIDYELSSRNTIRDAVKALIAQAPDLTRYGAVEVVVADPSPRRLLAPTTDAKALADALTTASKMNAQSRLAQVRRAFLASRSDMTGSAEEKYSSVADTRGSVAEESALIHNFLGRLSTWIGAYPRRGTRALFLVADGFDVNPGDFYAETLYPSISEGRNSALARTATGQLSEQEARRQQNMIRADREQSKLQSESITDARRAYHPLAREAAAAGWTIISLRGGLNAELAAESSMGSGNNAVANFMGGSGGSGNPSRGLQVRPVEALVTFAEATGGELVADTSRFGRTIDTLGNRVRLTYQVSRPVDGVVRQIIVKPRRTGLIVSSAQFASSSTPELTAASRVTSIMTGGEMQGELPIAAKLALEPASRGESPKGTLEARVGLAPLSAIKSQLKSTAVRVTIGVGAGNDQPRVIHQLHQNFDLSQLNQATFTSPMQLPKNVDKVAVVIEDLTTGAWGGAVLPLAKNQNSVTTAGWTEGTAEPMAWEEWDPALARAQKEKKLILQCAGCDEKLFGDSSLRNLLGAFVVTRKADGGNHVVLLDPWGRARYDWKVANAPELVGKLRGAMGVGGNIVRAGELLAGGDSAEAHFAMGFAYLRTQSFAEAQKEYGLAEAAAKAAGDANMAQRAQIQSAAAMAQAGKRDDATRALESIVKTPQSPANEAEAWLILGHLRKAAGNLKGAKDAYSNAAARAPQGSELQKVATSLAGSV